MTTDAGGFVKIALPTACELNLPPDVTARVRATPGIERDVTRLLADIDQKEIQFTRSEARAQAMLTALRAVQ
ncbi:MAG: hypothetical protein QM759_03040 [Terricaulis sp.]